MEGINSEETNCRYCGRSIIEKTNGAHRYAYIGNSKELAKWNYYGGWVCTQYCDRNACLEMESSFPGAGRATTLSSGAASQVKINWQENG
jgi:hypothetical protein